MDAFQYIYRVENPGVLGMEYAVQHTWHPGQVRAMFRDAVDAQAWVDMLRAGGEHVSVMPSAEGIIR